MLSFRFLFTFGTIRISQTCLPNTKRLYDQKFDVKPALSINDLEDIVTELNVTNYLYQYYVQKRLKNEACHACPEFKSPNCTILKKGLKCVKPKVWYHRGSYCLHAEFACNRSFHALQGRIIDRMQLNDDYADPSEDDTKHETYGVHQLHRLDERIQRFPIRGFKRLPRENLYCMIDRRWYYRSNHPPIIIRTDQIFCL
ncbi:hypothetical protein WUBG_02397 [Wuchereria bancrofti]|uniref:Uncharacterized protein n=1 Tax=Wuchereria bancrofti TaxID=6293 RepID=J9EVS8_WUCBA|nr:hypothetical protein WUBG_02397 [Wuchereria bancrofti]